MNKVMPASTDKSERAWFIGVMTLIWGAVCAAGGVRFLLAWADLVFIRYNDLEYRRLFEHDIPYFAVLGLFFLVFGVVALAAACGLCWRKPWGHPLLLLVGVLATASSVCVFVLRPLHSFDWDATVSLLVTAQVLYGILAIMIGCRNPDEPMGLHIIRVLHVLVGLSFVLFVGLLLTKIDFHLNHDHSVRTSRGNVHALSREDLNGLLGLLALVSFLGVALLWVATAIVLNTPRLRRFKTVISLMIAAGSAETALAAFCWLGGRRINDYAGLYLLYFFLPIAVVLLLLTAGSVLYLRQPAIRRTLDAMREQRQGCKEQSAAPDRPRDGFMKLGV